MLLGHGPHSRDEDPMTRIAYTTSPRPPDDGLLSWNQNCQWLFDDDLETERGQRRTLRTDLVNRLRPGDEIVTPSPWMFFDRWSGAEALLRTIVVERQASITFAEKGLTLGPCTPEELPHAFEKIRREVSPISIPPEVAERFRQRVQLGLFGTRGRAGFGKAGA